jgi:hypothetical protein
MKFNIKLNGVVVERDIPEAYHKLSWSKLLEIYSVSKHPVKEQEALILSILTGIDLETIKKAHIKNYDVLMSCLAFLQNEMPLMMPTTIMDMTVPKNIEDEAAARYGDIQEIIGRFKEGDKLGNLAYYPEIVSRYVSPSPYDWRQADEIANKLQDAPCSEVMAIGNFTLTRYHASRSGTLTISPQEDTRLSRWRQVILIWLKSLDSSIRFALWKRSLPSSARKYLNGL